MAAALCFLAASSGRVLPAVTAFCSSGLVSSSSHAAPLARSVRGLAVRAAAAKTAAPATGGKKKRGCVSSFTTFYIFMFHGSTLRSAVD
jgi:hypothetical protein